MRLRFITRKDGSLYLFRIVLIKTPWFSVYIHRFVASDPQHPHDHPWSFLSIPLVGRYREERWHGEHDPCPHGTHAAPFACRSVAKGRWLPRFRRAETRHVVSLWEDKRRPWTLVITGRRRRDWFFYLPSGRRVWWKDYLALERLEMLGKAQDNLAFSESMLKDIKASGEFNYDTAFDFIRNGEPGFGEPVKGANDDEA